MHKSLEKFAISVTGIECERSLFSLKIRGKNAKQEPQGQVMRGQVIRIFREKKRTAQLSAHS